LQLIEHQRPPWEANMPRKPKRKAGATSKVPANKRKKAMATTQPKPTSTSMMSAVPYTPRQTASGVMYAILHPDVKAEPNPNFRDAPDGWTEAQAEAAAAQSNLKLTEDHWEVVRVLQGCYRDEVSPRLRLLHDALQARFAAKGGMKYLFTILPGGPIAQGCALAGLKPPAGARDISFGSVA
jgi:tRNA 2-thiouridine synthesizing protein E